MKVIVPLAGFGKRMRPQTWSRPKPLLNVAGKPLLGHILDKFKPLDVDDAVFIVGWLGDQIQDYVASNYDFKAHYVVQSVLKGQAHALYLAREYLSGPCIIVFVDTLFEADLSALEQTDADAILFTQEVQDPRRFGVVVEEQGRITRLIEKPDGFEYRKAVIGLYYVREGAMLREAVEQVLTRNIQTKGEYYLADAFQAMIDQGAHIISQSVDAWEDCGEPDTLLHTNRWLLDHGRSQEVATRNAILVPPVYVAPTAVIEDSVVGPYATIGDNVHIKDAIVRDAIVDEGSVLESVALEHSLIGRNAVIKGKLHRLNIGDNSQVGVNGDI